MKNNIAISFDNIGKLYRLGTVGTGTLSHDLNRWWKTSVLGQEDPYSRVGEINNRSSKGKSNYVWALKDISFDVNSGEVVGIIGKNGAGKSTLLKLLSRVTSPTKGEIKVRGRIASLLEVGTGFHPEMTGRENIYMNGSIMGMTRKEITRKLPEIVDFAGVERYVDTPVKRYSSGMTVRLGFAIAAFLDPEILVVDEVLAVGDAEFQKKAIGKMQDVSHSSGRTVLFVSHNMAAVKSLCSRGIVLENGQATFDGSISDAIQRYLSINEYEGGKIVEHISEIKKDFNVDSIELNGSEDYHTNIYSGQQYLDLKITGYSKEVIKANAIVRFKTVDEIVLASCAEGYWKGNIVEISAGKFEIKRRIQLPKILSAGICKVDILLNNPNVQLYFKANNCAQIQFDGYQEGYGSTLLQRRDGFVGLEMRQDF